MKLQWWKIIGIILVLYSIIGGVLLPVPRLPIVNESIRNLYFHVPMWFGMIALLVGNVYHSINYLRKGNIESDLKSQSLNEVAIVFGVLGLVTGMIWANYTWGTPWHGDVKQNNTAITLLIYTAYFILRSAIEDREKKARVSAVYSIFAFSAMIPLLFVIPRMYDSLHPGNGGNPGFNSYDLDSRMRLIFYPAVFGWIMIGFWISELKSRTKILIEKSEEI